MSYTGLLQKTAKQKLLEASLLQYPAVFEQALYKLSWTKAPKRLLSTVKQMELAGAKVESSRDLDERYWQVWAQLQKEHALD